MQPSAIPQREKYPLISGILQQILQKKGDDIDNYGATKCRTAKQERRKPQLRTNSLPLLSQPPPMYDQGMEEDQNINEDALMEIHSVLLKIDGKIESLDKKIDEHFKNRRIDEHYLARGKRILFKENENNLLSFQPSPSTDDDYL